MKGVSEGCGWKMRWSCYAVALTGARVGVPCVALLQTKERGVAAAAAQQIVVPAALDDLAALDHQDGVGMHDGVQAVGDHDGGAVLAEMLDRFLHLPFRIPNPAPRWLRPAG